MIKKNKLEETVSFPKNDSPDTDSPNGTSQGRYAKLPHTHTLDF